VITPADVDVCDADPGYAVDVTVTADLRRLVEVWRGDLDWSGALRTGAVEVHGPQALSRAVPRWFALSAFAAVPRPA
jgi:putative sterol carrier protein